jgi:uncharacterized protein YlaI
MRKNVKRFMCQLCDYETNVKSQIHSHHIEPREVDGTNKKWNKILVCPNCHNRIFSPLASTGIHAKKHENSIEIIGWRNNGMFLEIIDENKNLKLIPKK